MLHGHCATAPVVKLHENEPFIAYPRRSAPPTPSTVYVVLARQRTRRRERRHRVPAVEAHRPGHAVPARVLHRERHRAGLHRLRERRRRRHRHRTPVDPRSASHPSPPAACCPPTARTPRRPSSWWRCRCSTGRVRRAVGVHAAAGQRGQRPVRHRRRQPLRGDRVVPGIGVIRGHIRRPRRDLHRGGEVQLLPARPGLTAERARSPATSRRQPTSCRYASRCCRTSL